MAHNRPISAQDHSALLLIQQNVGRVVLTPVFLNGEARQAFAIVEENEAGIYLRILGVALNPGDTVQDKLGQPGSFTPPVLKSALN